MGDDFDGCSLTKFSLILQWLQDLLEALTMGSRKAALVLMSMVVALLYFPLYFSGYSNILEALTMGSMDAVRVIMSVMVALLIFPYITVVTRTFSRPLQ